jgi:Ca2+-binding RTX toxin-like protein
VSGGAGDDLLLGGAGGDVDGGAGGDSVYAPVSGTADGGTGEDLVQVSASRATVRGGAGRGGRDTFATNALGGDATADRDTLADFTPGEDKISFEAVAGLTGEPFGFIGTRAFSGAGQVRYSVGGGKTLVEASSDADAAPEAVFEIPRAVALKASDFLLGRELTSGADTVAGTPWADYIVGGAGDRITGGGGIDFLQGFAVDGGAGRDNVLADGRGATARGGDGDDRVTVRGVTSAGYGGAGDDELVSDLGTGIRLFGEAGNDILRDFGGDMLLSGGDGDDRLFASEDDGTDRLEGGAGADRLEGTGDGDQLRGGPGGDTFVFGRNYGLGTLDAGADVILDFVRGPDTIDVGGIDASGAGAGDQDFAFIGTRAFSGASQLRIAKEGGDTVVQGSTDLDAAPEFEIVVRGNLTLTADDFVL